MVTVLLRLYPNWREDAGCVTLLGFFYSGRHFIAFARRPPAAPPHDLVESVEIGPRFPVREEPRCLERRDLFGNRCSHKLIHAGSVLPAEPFHRLFK